ncbi:MAG: AlpA family transcriptional regulator [Sulfurimonas sp.]|nr:AlpA family transcriptional regulator [Sulfurimonas sp.]
MESKVKDRLLRLPEVLARTGISRSTLYENMKAGRFPKQQKPTPRCSGWRESDIEAVINGEWDGGTNEVE